MQDFAQLTHAKFTQASAPGSVQDLRDDPRRFGGILILEANDLDHAVRLMSQHPGVRAGPFEIRPAADLTGMIRESERRRGAGTRS